MDQEETFWDILEIDPTSERRTIKRAYAKALKQCNPEDDPEGFSRLRHAYEMALEAAQYFDQNSFSEHASQPDDQSVVNQAEAVQEFQQSVPVEDQEVALPKDLQTYLQQLTSDTDWELGFNQLEEGFQGNAYSKAVLERVYSEIIAKTLNGDLPKAVLVEMGWRWFFRDDHFLLPFESVGIEEKQEFAEHLHDAMFEPIQMVLDQIQELSQKGDDPAILKLVEERLNDSVFDPFPMRNRLRIVLRRHFATHHHQYSHLLLIHLDRLLMWRELTDYQSDEDYTLAEQLENRLYYAERNIHSTKEQPAPQQIQQENSTYIKSFLKYFFLIFLLINGFLICTRQKPAKPNNSDRWVHQSTQPTADDSPSP